MAFCFQNPNATIPNTIYTCAQALATTFTLPVSISYLRPNKGGALLPWIYTVVIILIHIPVVVIRVVRWEVVQAWCIFFSIFTIIVVTQSYVSTQFDPAKILIWTPIILVIDAGSMIQVFFLVIEAKKRRLGPRILLVDPPGHGQKDTESNAEGTQQFSSLLTRFRRKRQGHQEQIALLDQGSHISPQKNPPTATAGTTTPAALSSNESLSAPRGDNNGTSQPVQQMQPSSAAEAQPANGQAAESGQRRDESTTNKNSSDNIDGDVDLCWYKDPAVWSAAFAALCFTAVVVLQVLGLVKAAQAIRSGPPLVSWCSPLFQPFGITALDGDGHAYAIVQDRNKGIGCIEIPGVWQRGWLKGTLGVLILELVFEFLDTIILTQVSSSYRWRGVKMRRPWFSIILGMIVLLVTLICGIWFASELPPEITKSVKVIMVDSQGAGGEGRGIIGSYDIALANAGLRGAVIGWSDGLFDIWNSTYFGGLG